MRPSPGPFRRPPSITARTALRRSLIIWGWGQASLGEPRAWLLATTEVLALAVLALVGVPRMAGPDAGLVFAAGAIFFAAWGAIAVDAYRRAAEARRLAGLAAEDGGAIDLLWLTGPLMVASTLFWTGGGTLGSPQATLARYVTDWRQGRADDAGLLFDSAPVPAAVQLAWGHQQARLRDALAALAATAPGAGIDPAAPFDSLRFDLAGGDATSSQAILRLVRREEYASTFFGLFPTTAQRLVSMEDVGHARLRMAGGEWRIVEVDLLGERLG